MLRRVSHARPRRRALVSSEWLRPGTPGDRSNPDRGSVLSSGAGSFDPVLRSIAPTATATACARPWQAASTGHCGARSLPDSGRRRSIPPCRAETPFKTHNVGLPNGFLQVAVSKTLRRSAVPPSSGQLCRRSVSDTALRLSLTLITNFRDFTIWRASH